MSRIYIYVGMALLFIVASSHASAHRVHNRQYKFSMDLPDAMMPVADTSTDGQMYYDTSARVILMVSERTGRFHSVDEYINCKQEKLEEHLRDFYSDSTLTLVSCSRSEFYPEQCAVLLFHEQALPAGFNTCLVYFVHHQSSDMQFSFTYREGEVDADKYVKAIMGSLKLH